MGRIDQMFAAIRRRLGDEPGHPNRRHVDHGWLRYRWLLVYLAFFGSVLAVVLAWSSAGDSAARSREQAATAKALALQAKAIAAAATRTAVETTHASALAACKRGNVNRRQQNATAVELERQGRSLAKVIQQVIRRSQATISDPASSPAAKAASRAQVRFFRDEVQPSIVLTFPRQRIVDCATVIPDPFSPTGPKSGP